MIAHRLALAVLVLAASCGVTPYALAQSQEIPPPNHAWFPAELCAGTRDARPTLASMLSTYAGKTIVIPAKCKLLLSSPGAGSAAATLQTGTSLLADGGNAQIRLAGKKCAAGTYTGAACSSDSDCRDGGAGSCQCELGSGSCQFAPTGGSTYTVLSAASGATDIAVRGVDFMVRQADPFGRCAGGTDVGLPCSANANCASSYCDYHQGSISGAGKVNVIDFRSAGDGAVVEEVNVYDHRTGALTIGVNGTAWVYRNDLTRAEYNGRCEGGSTNEGNSCATGFACDSLVCTYARAVTEAITVAGNESFIGENSVVAGGPGTGIALGSGVYHHVTHNTVLSTEADGASVGISMAGQQNEITGNTVLGGYTCFRPANATAGNVNFATNRCVYQRGPAVIVPSYGFRMDNNYTAWGAPHCVGGTRDYQACSVNSTARGTGCPGASGPTYCDFVNNGDKVQVGGGSDDTIPGGTTHLELTNNIIHAGGGLGTVTAKLISFKSSTKRCDSGTRRGLTCTTDDTNATTGCPSALACPNCCDVSTVDASRIEGNTLYTGTSGSTGIDLSAYASGTATVTSLAVLANHFTLASETANMAYPSSGTNLLRVDVVGNDFDGGLNITNPAVAYAVGDWKGNAGALYTDTQVTESIWLRNTSGSTINAGDLVEASTATQDNVKQATSSSQVVLGVALHDCATATNCQIATAGVVPVNGATTPAVAKGDRVRASSTAGKADSASATDNSFGIAVQDKAGSTSAQFRVKLQANIGSPSSVSYPLSIFNAAASLDATSTYYVALQDSSLVSGKGTTSGGKAGILPGAVTLRRINCTLGTAPTGATKTRTCTPRKNGTDQTAWACTITNTAKSCCVTTAASGCDVNNATGLQFAAGDTWEWKVTPANSPSTSDIALAAEFTVDLW